MNTHDHDHEQEQEPMTTEELARILFAPPKNVTTFEVSHEPSSSVSDADARAFLGLPPADSHNSASSGSSHDSSDASDKE